MSAFVSLSKMTMEDETNMAAQLKTSDFSRPPAADPCRNGVLALPDPFVLESGELLRNGRVAWQCVGPEHAPLIVVLGGISAHRRVGSHDGRGWWESQCGPNRSIDTSRFRVLGIDWLGGCDDSSGPNGDRDFPSISTSDQARALLLLLNRFGVRRVHALVGASYGGLVAQQLAALLGDRVHRLVLFSAAHRPSQFGIALRRIQRTILDLADDTDSALALARSLAVLGYRTPEGVEARFGGETSEGDVLGWLTHHGERFVGRFNPAAYRCLGKSLDTHRIDPATIRVPTTVFAVRDDLIVPISLLRDYAERAGGSCNLVEITSPYGHDAFLKEDIVVDRVLRSTLEIAP